MKLKYYVISLKHQTTRQASIKAQLDTLGINFEFFEGVNGREMSEADRALCADSDGAVLPCRWGLKVKITNALTPGERGCALSHLKLYQKILDDYEAHQEQYGTDFAAVIMEDDLVLNANLVLALNSLDVITEPWDVVQFSDHNSVRSPASAPRYYFEQEHGLYFARVGYPSPLLEVLQNLRRFVACAACYVVKPQACQRLIELGYPVRIPADYLLGLLSYNRLKTMRAYPLGHFLDYVGGSDIGERPEHALISHGLWRVPKL